MNDNENIELPEKYPVFKRQNAYELCKCGALITNKNWNHNSSIQHKYFMERKNNEEEE